MPNTNRDSCNVPCVYPYVSTYFFFKDSSYQSIHYCQSTNFGYTSHMNAVITVMVMMYFCGLLMIPLSSISEIHRWGDIKLAFGFLILTTIPVIDSITDIAYLMTNDFWGMPAPSNFFFAYLLPILSLTSIFTAMGHFVFHLFELNAWCKFRLVPIPKSLSYENYDDLFKVLSVVPWMIMNLPFWFPWLVLGCFLYITKIFAVGKVANFWLYVWTGGNAFQTDTFIDAKLLNTAIYSEILYETLPQLIIQVLNSTLLNSWTTLSIFSVAFSILSACSGVYRTFFYKTVRKIKLKDIPLIVEICGIKFIDIDPRSGDKVYPEPNYDEDDEMSGEMSSKPIPMVAMKTKGEDDVHSSMPLLDTKYNELRSELHTVNATVSGLKYDVSLLQAEVQLLKTHISASESASSLPVKDPEILKQLFEFE